MSRRKPPKSLPSTEQLLNRAYAALEASHNYLLRFQRQQNEFDKGQEDFRPAQPNLEDLVREERDRKDYIEHARASLGQRPLRIRQ